MLITEVNIYTEDHVNFEFYTGEILLPKNILTAIYKFIGVDSYKDTIELVGISSLTNKEACEELWYPLDWAENINYLEKSLTVGNMFIGEVATGYIKLLVPHTAQFNSLYTRSTYKDSIDYIDEEKGTVYKLPAIWMQCAAPTSFVVAKRFLPLIKEIYKPVQ